VTLLSQGLEKGHTVTNLSSRERITQRFTHSPWHSIQKISWIIKTAPDLLFASVAGTICTVYGCFAIRKPGHWTALQTGHISSLSICPCRVYFTNCLSVYPSYFFQMSEWLIWLVYCITQLTPARHGNPVIWNLFMKRNHCSFHWNLQEIVVSRSVVI